MSKTATTILWTAKIIAALIMLQTLFFKFSASEESVYIFRAVGMEPYGRIMVGVLELVAAILILLPVTAYLGAGLALGLMLGALGMHFTILGIEVMNDGGQLFIYALVVSLCSIVVLWFEREKIALMVHTILFKKG
jgi:putative oxidoreductase